MHTLTYARLKPLSPAAPNAQSPELPNESLPNPKPLVVSASDDLVSSLAMGGGCEGATWTPVVT